MSRDSHALVLEISKHADRLEMGIFEQKELVSTVRHYSHCLISAPQINKLCREVTLILNKINRKDNSGSDPIISLRKVGQLLWDQLLSRAVKDKLKAASSKDLLLSLDEGLIHVPWELLYDSKDFLCLKFNLGRIIRARGQNPAVQYRSAHSTLKMLILANPTNDLKSSYREGLDIKNQFYRKKKEISIDFKSTYIDDLYVKKNLRDYDIVHFAGHCEYDSRNPENSGWLLKDGKLTAQDILALSESSNLPALVFSNACQSAEISPDVMPLDYQEKTYSLASAFLFAGVRHYIGTVRKIEDHVSLIFAREFYARLVDGFAVGECIRLGRIKLIKECGVESVSWANYLLYGDPNFAIFSRKTEIPASRLKYRRIGFKKVFLRYAGAVLIMVLSLGAYIWLPSINPSTYFLFIQSRNLFQRGLNKDAVLICNRIITQDPSFLAVYPLIAESYHRMGKINDALRYYFEYAFYSQKKHDKKSLASAYIDIGWVYQLSGEYPKALDFYNKAITLSLEAKDKLGEAVALRKMAVWYLDKEDSDRALELLTKSSEINRENQNLPQHAYNLACDYFDTGLVFANKDDFKSAREFYSKSQSMFEKLKLTNELSDCYFNLGETYLLEKQYQLALGYYQKGLGIDESQGNKLNLAGDYDMIGELYTEMGNLKEAEKFFKQALLICEEVDLHSDLAYTCYNLGLLYRTKGDTAKAKEYLIRSQDIYRYVDAPIAQKVKQALADLKVAP